ncbi:uncharacterized protein LOC144918264 [Branchiostoma floridae x Branchiostoma belcheri]
MSSKKLFPNGEAAPEGSVRPNGTRWTNGIVLALSGLAAVVSFVALLFMAREMASIREQQMAFQKDLQGLRDQMLQMQLKQKKDAEDKIAEHLSPKGPTGDVRSTEYRRDHSATFWKSAEVHRRFKRNSMDNTVPLRNRLEEFLLGKREPSTGPPGPPGPPGPRGPPGQCCAGAGATAAPGRPLPVTTALSVVDAHGFQVRLVDGSTPLEGRVEVRVGTRPFGTVCDDRWDLKDAQVVCGQLGFGKALAVKLGAHFGKGDGKILLDGVDCEGSETSLGDCHSAHFGHSDCSHKEDAGVVCEGKLAVRLAGGDLPWEGRVEFRPGDKSEWRAVCNNGWTETEAGTVCKQLGYTGSVSTGRTSTHSSRTWLERVSCSGTKTNIASCALDWNSGSFGCPSYKMNVQVVCTGDVSIRLAGGQRLSEGRVEVRAGLGDWGTVCDDGFDDRDAEVVCRQLKYGLGVATQGSEYPGGTGNIYLNNLNCDGSESSVADCGITKWGGHDCTHKEDAAVKCIGGDCAAFKAAGHTTSGVYTLGSPLPGVEVYCDMETDGGGWTVIQRRLDGSVAFDRTWEEYKHGFGNKDGNYWLGNENIHLLTSKKDYSLRIDLEDWSGNKRYAEYDTFRVAGESDAYRLTVSGYSGTAGNSVTANDAATNNGRMFYTKDRTNGGSGTCSRTNGNGGWWYGKCGYVGLNGQYLPNCVSSCSSWIGLVWYEWPFHRGPNYSMKTSSVKIRPK